MTLLIDTAARVSIVLALGLVAASLLRTRSASSRHWILAAALAGAAAVPVLGLIAPSWQVTVAPSVLRDTPAPITQPADERITTTDVVVADAPVVETRDASSSVASMLMWTWLAGVGVCALLLVTGLARLAWLASRARRLTSGPWVDRVKEVSREAGLARRVRLLHGSHPALLVTWGFVRPTILLPQTALEWSDERIRIVLRHEIAHIRRHDWIVQLVAEGLHAIHWFNPLVWIACRRVRDEGEQACDDEVIAGGVEPALYATHLLDLARLFTSGRRPWLGTPAMAQPCSLERRISAMLNTRVNRSPVTRSFRVATGVSALLVTMAVAGGVLAQSGTATFAGSVVDPTGAPLPGTTITLTHKQSTAGHASPTDQSGAFEFSALEPGEYTLEARAVGFRTVKETIELRAGETVRRDMRLNIGSIEESITMRGHDTDERRPSRTGPSVASIIERMRGQRLQPPIKLTDARPKYPQALIDSGVEGRVVLEGRLGTDGVITDMQVVESAHPELVAAARDAASQWRFEPTRLWGTPVEIGITMTFNFER